ncbi:MAG: sirohydrochlorin cobaltochelatase, partial [Deltaproteobacteria bacterium]|nr:sirohydrochlorin cobaltochelatase [Deltaproteobacteria bacterium]
MAVKTDLSQKAIIMAAFGTSHPKAVESILNVKTKVEQTFPGIPVRLAFTSRAIRGIWHRRAADDNYRKKYPELPADLYEIKGPLATMCDFNDLGFQAMAVQSLHIFAGEEYTDLKSVSEALKAIRTLKAKYKPFKVLALGRPALGEPSEIHDYREDLAAAAEALTGDVGMARQNDAALVYVGHGNPSFSTGVYAELASILQRKHPDRPIFIGVIEGFPSRESVLSGLKQSGAEKVVLVPLMLTAGDHVVDDLFGDHDDSWRSFLSKAGIQVAAVFRGLGEVTAWAEIYVRHLKEAMIENGLILAREG